jgi:hypothetical protein
VAGRILRVANGGGIVPTVAGKLLHAERDGSLSCGFELVSRPLDLEGQRALWSTVLVPSVVSGLRSHQTTTCGLHVHMTRASLTKLQTARMVVCLNAPTWAPLVTALARRYQTGYCHIGPKKLGSALTYHGGKYDALNVSRNATVEFRIFRGSLNATAVIAALEFCHALAEFCGMPGWAPASVSGDLSPDSFLAFLSCPEIRSETRTLRAYLARRGVVNVEAKEARPRAVPAHPALAAAPNETDDARVLVNGVEVPAPSSF